MERLKADTLASWLMIIGIVVAFMAVLRFGVTTAGKDLCTMNDVQEFGITAIVGVSLAIVGLVTKLITTKI